MTPEFSKIRSVLFPCYQSIFILGKPVKQEPYATILLHRSNESFIAARLRIDSSLGPRSTVIAGAKVISWPMDNNLPGKAIPRVVAEVAIALRHDQAIEQSIVSQGSEG